MSQTARIFEHDDIGIAWGFVLECEDDDPRCFGVDLLPAFPTRRYGVFRQRSHADATVPWFDETARVYEDELVARLDGEIGDDEDDEEPEAPPATDLEDEIEVCEDDVISCEPDAPADPTEAIPSREGLGRRARRAPIISLRRG